MISFPFWIGILGWLGTALFWAVVVVVVILYRVIKWLNSKL